MPVDVDRLQQGAHVRFPGRDETVSLVAVRPGPFWEFYFDGPSGPVKYVLAESELTSVEVIDILRAPGNRCHLSRLVAGRVSQR